MILQQGGDMARSVSDIVVEQLGDWGIRYIFGVMGETVLGLLNAVRHQDRIRFVAMRQESMAAFAASAYGKLTGEPAACIATAGPGAVGLMPGVYDAQYDRAPMLAITGQVRRSWQYEGAWQEIDAHALFEPVTVFNAAAETAAQAPAVFANALQTAVGKQGVAHVQVPSDLQMMEAVSGPIRPQGHMNWSQAAAGDDSLRQAARLLAGASRPVILMGWGAREAREPLLQVAHRLGAPVLTTCRSKGLLPASEPLSMGVVGHYGTPLADHFLREADTILVVGCSLSQNTTNEWRLIQPQQQLIQIDNDRSRIGQHYAVAVGLWGDAAPTVRRLVPLLPEGPVANEWGDLHARKSEFMAQVNPKATDQSVPIKPQFVVRTLQETLPADAVIALDVGDHAYFMCQQYEPKGEKFVTSYHLASMGFGLPAALAACLAYPERPAVAVVGDGGLAISLGEMITLVEHNLPVTIVCFNNARLGMMNSDEERLALPPFFTELPQVSFAQVAQSVGLLGARVEQPAVLADAIHQALAAKMPYLIDVAIDPLERESTALEPARAEVRV